MLSEDLSDGRGGADDDELDEGLDEELDEGLDEELDDELDEDVRDARVPANRLCSVAVGQLAVLDKVRGLMKKQVAGVIDEATTSCWYSLRYARA